MATPASAIRRCVSHDPALLAIRPSMAALHLASRPVHPVRLFQKGGEKVRDISGIPDQFIAWNQKLGFHDLREVMAQKLAAALQRAGLAHLIDKERWILDMPERLCTGCIFDEDAWRARLSRDTYRAREARRSGRRGGARKKPKSNGAAR